MKSNVNQSPNPSARLEMSHDDVYILDSSLVIGYLKNDIPGWKAWADEHIKMGKKFHLVGQTMKEFEAKKELLPVGFERLRLKNDSDEKGKRNIGKVYEGVRSITAIAPERKSMAKVEAGDYALNPKAEKRIMTRLMARAELIAQAGDYAFAPNPAKFFSDYTSNSKIVLASTNRGLKDTVDTEQKRDLVEKLLVDNGFERLVKIRSVDCDLATFVDFP
jgi:hypothetical protein